jgi:hypothetical protein
MTGLPQVPLGVRTCPFCGMATDVPHETQEGCIAALNAEISRMRGLLSQLRPAGHQTAEPEPQAAEGIRLVLSNRHR